jgi:hypothetical protein
MSPAATSNGLQKKQIKMDGIPGPHRRMLIEHEIFVSAARRQRP